MHTILLVYAEKPSCAADDLRLLLLILRAARREEAMCRVDYLQGSSVILVRPPPLLQQQLLHPKPRVHALGLLLSIGAGICALVFLTLPAFCYTLLSEQDTITHTNPTTAAAAARLLSSPPAAAARLRNPPQPVGDHLHTLSSDVSAHSLQPRAARRAKVGS